MKIETLAIHSANHPDPVTGAIAPSISLSTTYARDESGELVGDFSYSRSGNPNRLALEFAAAELEGGAAAFAFASGVAAIFSILHTLKPGDHVLAPMDVYHGTHALLLDKAEWGLEVSFVDMDELEQVAGAIQANTRLILVETPSNPMLRISDIREIVRLAASAGARVAVDNTWATPVLQHPIALGADYSVHSSTKYFGGHSDVLGGMVVCKDEDDTTALMRDQQWIVGAVPSPFDCWLIRRGLMTMPVRVRAQTNTAGQLAAFLENHPQVRRVHYPGLHSHPNHAVAAAQMEGFGAMLSFQVKGGEAAAARIAGGVRLFTAATSLGAVESLIEHRYRVEGVHSKTPVDLLRVSVGLEHVDDLKEDLEWVLKKAAS